MEVDSIVKIGELEEVSFPTKMVGVGDVHKDQTHAHVYCISFLCKIIPENLSYSMSSLYFNELC
ncbi:hypothetical protein MtrunA17_Chr2g0299241 [Medicago truncatula]|uniref:Uncharacterized protein n=1 Tax=Medicago truncatula TaxID=3880 RepID=A0A396JAR6_MEDTR|nr:hypothetical protein MtrunA17_Chr2g0299241 [Medicago truncatula]